MTLLYYSPRFLEHNTGQHPERAERLLQSVRHLERVGLDQKCTRPTWEPASLERIARVHHRDYLDELQEFAKRGGGVIEADTVMSRDSLEIARLASGAVCDAVERVVRGEETQALCLLRPPGHHALQYEAMGFCLLNHLAVGARLAIDELGLERVLIVDWDVHHGNGTQAIFWEDPQVGYLSLHRWPFYPGTGSAEETGSGAGAGTTVNLPVEMGTSRERILSLFARELEAFAAKLKPQLILVSAGFDAHQEDPIGSLGLETEDFEYFTAAVLDIAAAHADNRIVSMLEGGYNPSRLAGCLELHLQTMLERQGG